VSKENSYDVPEACKRRENSAFLTGDDGATDLADRRAG